jgi:REP element-mobilizing transposase RayT
MECVFGKILESEMILNEWGMIADAFWREIPHHFSGCSLDSFIVMPDHMHGIIIIEDYFKHSLYGTGMPVPYSPKEKCRPSIPIIIGSYKSASSKRIHQAGYPEFKWHKSYYDRIIRDEDEFRRIRKYIAENPIRKAAGSGENDALL